MFKRQESNVKVPELRKRTPFLTRLSAWKVIDLYLQDRDKIIGVEESDRGLNSALYGIGTILTFDENIRVTKTADAYWKMGQVPTAQEPVAQAITPFVGVIACVKKSEQAIVGFQKTPLGLLRPVLMCEPGDDGYVFQYTNEDEGVTAEIFYDEVRIAREVPIDGSNSGII